MSTCFEMCGDLLVVGKEECEVLSVCLVCVGGWVGRSVGRCVGVGGWVSVGGCVDVWMGVGGCGWVGGGVVSVSMSYKSACVDTREILDVSIYIFVKSTIFTLSLLPTTFPLTPSPSITSSVTTSRTVTWTSEMAVGVIAG